MPITVRELVTKLGFKVDNASIDRFNNAINNAKQDMNSLNANVNKFSRGMRNVGLGLTAFVTAPISLLGFKMIQAASDAEESAQKFNVVFRDMVQGANEVARAFGRDFGIARDKSKELLGTTGDLLTGFGFTQERALELSDRVARLGGDLASFNNIQGGTEEAVQRLTKGILGETENLKLLGIVVNQTTKEFRDRVASIQESTGATLQQAKAEAIFEQAVKQSGNAIGDFARTSDSFANRSRIFRSRIRDLAVSFGSILLPTANKVLGVFLKITDKIENLPEPVKKGIIVFAGIAAAIGPIILALGTLGLAVTGMISGWTALTGVMTAVGITFGAVIVVAAKIIAILAAVGFALYVLIDDFRTWASGGQSIIGEFLGSFESWKNGVMVVLNKVKELFVQFWTAITTNSDEAWRTFTDNIVNILFKLPGIFLKIFEKLIIVFAKFVYGVTTLFVNLGASIVKAFLGAFSRVLNFFGSFADSLEQRIKKSAVGKFFNKFGFFNGGPSNNSQGGQSGGGGLFSPVQAPIKTPSEILASAAPASSTQSVTIAPRIDIAVPPGTTEQQKTFLEQSAEESFERMFNSKMTDAILSNPKVEK